MTPNDRKIKNSLDPFVIIEISTPLSQEECDLIKDNLPNVLTEEEMSIFSEDILVAGIDDSQNEYLILNKSMVERIKIAFQKANFNYTMTDDIFEKVWNFTEDELNQFLDMFGAVWIEDEITAEFYKDMESSRQKAFSTLVVMANGRYDTDDVLDKISKLGTDSLNSINRIFLD